MRRRRFWRKTDTEWGVEKEMLSSNNKKFYVGYWFRDEDGLGSK